MKLTSIFLLTVSLQISARSVSQTITFKGENISLKDAFEVVKKQTGMFVFFNEGLLKRTSSVTLDVVKLPVDDFFHLLLKNQGLSFRVDRRSVILFRKQDKGVQRSKEGFIYPTPLQINAAINIRVIDSLGNPLAGASVTLRGKNITGLTDIHGNVRMEATRGDVVIVSFMGYVMQRIILTEAILQTGETIVRLLPEVKELDEVNVVYSTGYQHIPKERATGSFTLIDNKLLNRNAGYSILDRLEGITNGLLFNRTKAAGENNMQASLQIRGLSTLMSDESVLVIVDNFPYDGDINLINPNDVESISVLRDAAAASIWGARAGNGVIVIQTKKGTGTGKTHVSYTMNASFQELPDLYYDWNTLPSSEIMKLQKASFEKGYYIENRNVDVLPDYVELLLAKQKGELSDDEFLRKEAILQQTDIRDQALKYLYASPASQQYAISVRGGNTQHRYYLSAGLDRQQNQKNLRRNNNERLNLMLSNSFTPVKGLELGVQVNYISQQAENNGISLSDVKGQPYNRLIEPDGTWSGNTRTFRKSYLDTLSDVRLVDWHYRPLQELELNDNSYNKNSLRLLMNAQFQLLDGLTIRVTYQGQKESGRNLLYYDPQSYYVRDMVNRFTQTDGRRIIPWNGILNLLPENQMLSHSGRAQISYNKNWRVHDVTVMGGSEIRQSVHQGIPGSITYDYNKEFATGSRSFNYAESYETFFGANERILLGGGSFTKATNRYLSHFGNGSYTYNGRYTVSASMRWDGSNIFGVKTNQKGVPLWSMGGLWNIHKETFYNIDAIPVLKLRVTYGSAGNINNSITTYPTAYLSSLQGELLRATLRSPGNPSLRWEKVATLNVGVDFSFYQNRFSGSFEVFDKKASDLIGNAFMGLSTGINWRSTVYNYSYNYADLGTRGIDLQLNTENKIGSVTWQVQMLFSTARDKILSYYNNDGESLGRYLMPGVSILRVGQPRDMLYAFPWHGLDPETGYPLIYDKNQEKTDDYKKQFTEYNADDLVRVGVASPKYFGSVRNTIHYKRFELSALLTWKAGYVFRRASYVPGSEFVTTISTPSFHQDYLRRWQKPGDEQFTDIPASIDAGRLSFTDMSRFYTNSTALIEKGDHIRLQDITLNYQVGDRRIGRIGLRNLRLYITANNLGVIWKAGKYNIDPDMPYAMYPIQKSITGGLQLEL